MREPCHWGRHASTPEECIARGARLYPMPSSPASSISERKGAPPIQNLHSGDLRRLDRYQRGTKRQKEVETERGHWERFGALLGQQIEFFEILVGQQIGVGVAGRELQTAFV